MYLIISSPDYTISHILKYVSKSWIFYTNKYIFIFITTICVSEFFVLN